MRRRQFWIFLLLVGVFGLWINPPSQAASHSPAFFNSNQSSHMLAIDDGGDTLVVVNPDSNSISLVDTASLTKTLEIPVGIDPRSVALNGDFVYVANQGSDTMCLPTTQEDISS